MADRDYLVTARKYRPSLFRELVAQEHVTETLKNAIQHERLAHAYLFSGPRGVGKTTAARILAKAINCETPREERPDGAEPCCTCDSCTSFEEGRSLNVFEMDAASNNKVDDVRELREKVRIPPQGEQKKVYILDEVHMLSKQAFNALLKTLEEPPAHALFIFATTEPHKVLPTILSRCQRFDFRRIPVPKIVARLREICDAEGIEADEESLMLLARKGDGALRDALSAFDQAISLCGTSLEYGELTQALGVVDQDLYFDLTDHLAAQDTAGVLELVRHVVRSGYDLQEFLAGLAEHLRNLLVVHSLGGDGLESVAESTRQQYVNVADDFSEPDLLRLLTVAGDAENDVKNNPQPRLKLETTLLKMAQMRRAADLREVLEKIDRLEQQIQNGELQEVRSRNRPSQSDDQSETPSGPADEKAGLTAEPNPSYESDGSSSPSPDAPDATDESSEKPTDTPSSGSTAAEDDPQPSPDADADESEGSEDEDDSAPDDSDPSVEYGDLFGPPALEQERAGGDGSPPEGSNGLSSDGDEPDSKATVAEPATGPSNVSADSVAEQWPSFVTTVKEKRISLGSLLGESEPVELTDAVLTVAVPKPLHRSTLRDQRRFLLEHLTAAFQASIDDVEFIVDASSPGGEETEAEEDALSPREKLQNLRDTYPALDVLFGEFGAEPVW